MGSGISKMLELTFVTTSISPVFLAIGISKFNEIRNWQAFEVWIWFALFVILIPVALGIIEFAKRHLEIVPLSIESVAPADKEVAAFLVAYILPLLSIIPQNWITLGFIVLLLYLAVLTTSNYHFNPIMSLIFRYHYYEVTIKANCNNGECHQTYIIMTKKTIRNCDEITKVVQVSDYMLLDVEG